MPSESILVSFCSPHYRITNDVAQIQEFINGIMRIMVKAPIIGIGAIILIMIQTPGQAPVMAGILPLSVW